MTVSQKAGFYALLLCLVAPGLVGIVIFGHAAAGDWSALQVAYNHFERAAESQDNLRQVYIASVTQNIHRLNLFADGTWTLMCSLLFAVGLHGLCCRTGPDRKTDSGPVGAQP